MEQFCNDLRVRAERYGIAIGQAELDDEVAGQFDGPTITLNENYDPTERSFYLAHSIGSIAEWSIHPDQSRDVFRELRDAKRSKTRDEARLKDALAGYLAFETTTWEFAVWLLQDTGHEFLLGKFMNFGRADMEAMRIFHTTGEASDWREFFSNWNKEVREGLRSVEPFDARPIPPFQAIPIPKQEIVQGDDDA